MKSACYTWNMHVLKSAHDRRILVFYQILYLLYILAANYRAEKCKQISVSITSKLVSITFLKVKRAGENLTEQQLVLILNVLF